MGAGETRLDPAQSLYLDFLRGAAALAVLFHHYSRHVAQVGHDAFPDVGQEAVMVFFVMSGFVIAMVAENRERDFRVFAAKRLARFYSVAAPVALVLVGCYLVTSRLDPAAYGWWGSLQAWPEKLAATLTFSTETAWWHNFTLPGGAPMWSMSYEFWYYFVFAFAVLFARRLWGMVLAALCAIWLGPNGLVLFVVWLMGVATFHLFRRVALPRAAAWALTLAGLAGAIALQRSGWRYSCLNTEVLFGADWDHATWFPYYYLVGLCLVMHILGVLGVLADREREFPGLIAGAIRRVAHCAFFLYLTHIPVMFLFKAACGGIVFPYLPALVACTTALVIGKPIEDLRFPLQRWLGARRAA
jgi:peptidoglycan/LPS O-acetylase OafA/YrhL